MQLQLALKFVLLLAIANGTPVIAEMVLGRFLSYPVDAGKTFIDGRPLFGSSKTIRGIAVAMIAASACAPVFGIAWTTGLVIGLAAMAGDLASSFVKRRMGRPPSSGALGLDQIPESLLPALACMNLLALTVADVILIVALFSVGELVLSRLLFKVHPATANRQTAETMSAASKQQLEGK
jgi:CDP-2,3-bis-(O-geranylgeranyl)-sn-glycerol synthase